MLVLAAASVGAVGAACPTLSWRGPMPSLESLACERFVRTDFLDIQGDMSLLMLLPGVS